METKCSSLSSTKLRSPSWILLPCTFCTLKLQILYVLHHIQFKQLAIVKYPSASEYFLHADSDQLVVHVWGLHMAQQQKELRLISNVCQGRGEGRRCPHAILPSLRQGEIISFLNLGLWFYLPTKIGIFRTFTTFTRYIGKGSLPICVLSPQGRRK